MDITFCLWFCFLLYFGSCNSINFCEYCECDSSEIFCVEVNFNEALNHSVPSAVSSSAKYLNIGPSDDTVILANDTLNVFPALHSLRIHTCPVAFVGQFVFEKLYHLSDISLETNGLHEIPGRALSKLRTSLHELQLVNQHFRTIPSDAFGELSNLRSLTITYNTNHLYISPGAFTGLVNLTGLYLSACYIGQIHNTTFWGLTKLQELDLSYNLLVEIPPATLTLNSLLKLDLSYNTLLVNLMDLIILKNATRLQVLQMGYCAISEISPTAVAKLKGSPSLTVANFDGNPFNCTLDLCSFASWYVSLPGPAITTRSPNFIPFITLSPPPGKGPYQCESNGQSLQEFFGESCLPDPGPSTLPPNEMQLHLVILSVAIIIVLFVVILVSFVVWKFRLINIYHRRLGNAFQRQANYGAVEDVDREYVFDAYVSHHEDDKPFVEDEMLPRLEDESGFDLCVSFRNFRLGSHLLDNVSSAQDASRAIIFIINERFMRNGQCKLELEMASTRMLEDEVGPGGQRIILIMMEVIAPELVNNTLRMLLNHVAYLEWDHVAEDRCWGQLIATLHALVPDRNEENGEGVDQGRDDEIEMVENEHDENRIV
ncbi:protein toll-like [Lytechinus pictus]|uniref:protein toll-like n=1 Tax=Lytechinus pictus TaxID=7653 RepID=UPI0030B9B3EA